MIILQTSTFQSYKKKNSSINSQLTKTAPNQANVIIYDKLPQKLFNNYNIKKKVMCIFRE